MDVAQVLTFSVWYLCGVAVTGQLIEAWFNSSFPEHVLWVLDKGNKGLTSDDIFDRMVEFPPLGSHTLRQLLTCPRCIGTWFAFGTALAFVVGAYLASCPVPYWGLLLASSPGWTMLANVIRKIGPSNITVEVPKTEAAKPETSKEALKAIQNLH
jgi:hypothetical protein